MKTVWSVYLLLEQSTLEEWTLNPHGNVSYQTLGTLRAVHTSGLVMRLDLAMPKQITILMIDDQVFAGCAIDWVEGDAHDVFSDLFLGIQRRLDFAGTRAFQQRIFETLQNNDGDLDLSTNVIIHEDHLVTTDPLPQDILQHLLVDRTLESLLFPPFSQSSVDEEAPWACQEGAFYLDYPRSSHARVQLLLDFQQRKDLIHAPSCACQNPPVGGL